MISQHNRLGVFYPPDNPDSGETLSLALQRFTGQEAVNGLFEFEVECISVTPGIDFDALWGATPRSGCRRSTPAIPTGISTGC